MKIRDLLVIVFTAIVALLVLGRAALADGGRPTNGAGGDCPALANSRGETGKRRFPSSSSTGCARTPAPRVAAIAVSPPVWIP